MGGARSRGPREGVVGRWVLRCWYWGMACAMMILDGDDDDYGEWGWGAGMRGGDWTVRSRLAGNFVVSAGG